ncbi:hypothetical protein Scep_014056 [Stephania cephalantha]|uniref:Uncharacterized protein n=1 Tax=Stephania cephalantha TaxID=152367 RepID=A0AAP0J1B6_9MAGN
MVAMTSTPARGGESSTTSQRMEALEMLVTSLMNRVESQEVAIGEWETRFDELAEDVRSVGALTTETASTMAIEVKLLKRAVGGSSEVAGAVKSRTKVPEPKKFSASGVQRSLRISFGIWSDTLLLVGTEESHEVIRPLCTLRVMQSSVEDRVDDDAAAGRPKIVDWEVLKRELKDQFLRLMRACSKRGMPCASSNRLGRCEIT